MALYLGSSEKLQVKLDNIIYNINLFSSTLITNSIRLLSLDNYILKDANGLYLTINEEDEKDD